MQYIHSADIIHRVSINPEITSCNELMCLKNVTQNLTLQNQEEIFWELVSLNSQKFSNGSGSQNPQFLFLYLSEIGSLFVKYPSTALVVQSAFYVFLLVFDTSAYTRRELILG